MNDSKARENIPRFVPEKCVRVEWNLRALLD